MYLNVKGSQDPTFIIEDDSVMESSKISKMIDG